MLFLSLIFVLFVSVAQSKKDEFRNLPSTTNAMCLEMGLRPLEKQKSRPWTRAEDLILEAQVEECGEGNWSKMKVPGRTRKEIQYRFGSSNRWTSSSVSNSNRLTDEESTRLREVIHALPNGVSSSRISWKDIAAEHFTGWKPEQLRQQWHNRISENRLVIKTVSLAAVPSATVPSATVPSATVPSATVMAAVTSATVPSATVMAAVASATVPSATVMAAVASATVAPVAVMAAVASQLTLAAYMTPGVEGAIDNTTLFGGSVFVCKGNFGMIDHSPTIALLKLKATLMAFGASVSNYISINTSKFINANIFHVNIPLILCIVSYQLIYL